jgi:hypothetical protein
MLPKTPRLLIKSGTLIDGIEPRPTAPGTIANLSGSAVKPMARTQLRWYSGAAPSYWGSRAWVIAATGVESGLSSISE